ncbi:MAG: ATP-binding cassette domain-containing protein [Actinobacteria bacterium]|nr:ATP-binding cassette domain-containing protein [Actinomycetota bacterium]
MARARVAARDGRRVSVSTPTGAKAAARTTEEPLLRVEGLTKRFPITRGIIFQREIGRVHAVEDVSFEIRRGETLGLVGESGCGKSTTARLLLKLIEPTAGRIIFDGRDISDLSRRAMRPLRREMQMIFQDPYSSLNPRQTIGQVIGAPYAVHGTEGNVKHRVQDLMDRVGLNPEHYNRYPHEFSGGQRQRIGVARALALSPKLIVCDEPVSALDVSIQAQILNLLESLQEDFDLTYLFISHDLGVVRHISDRIAVMYLGRLVEVADADDLYERPRMPYTAALLSAVPKGRRDGRGSKERIVLKGDVPSPVDPPSGCVFHPRCPQARLVSGSDDEAPENCRTEMPPLGEVDPAHLAACWHPVERGQELDRAAHA